jgi:hypothetical protein
MPGLYQTPSKNTLDSMKASLDLLSNDLTSFEPITVVARSKARTIFARAKTGILGSNPTRGIDVCVRLFCVCIVLCAGISLAAG